jgi:hypothetical protein
MERNKSIYRVLAAFYVILIVLTSCGNNIMVIKCPDGNPVTIHKNPEKAFPVYVKDFEWAVKINFKSLQLALNDSALGISAKQNIVKLRQDLDQSSSQLEMELKTAVFALQTSPCDKENSKRFWDLQHIITTQSYHLKNLGEQAKKTYIQYPDSLMINGLQEIILNINNNLMESSRPKNIL